MSADGYAVPCKSSHPWTAAPTNSEFPTWGFQNHWRNHHKSIYTYVPAEFPSYHNKKEEKLSNSTRSSYKRVDRSSQCADHRLSGEGSVGEFRKCTCRAKQTNLKLRATLRVTIAQTRAESSEIDLDIWCGRHVAIKRIKIERMMLSC